MRLLEQSLETCAANLALDAWLLERAEQGGVSDPVLRIWEASRYAVVLGRGSRRAQEVDDVACALDRVPLYRRCSGGASVVLGPGCLVYSLILPRDPDSGPAGITRIHRQVLQQTTAGFAQSGIAVESAGISDLSCVHSGTRLKCGGNSLRVGRDYFLYHGTILYDLDLPRVSRWLKHPPREPEYRAGRTHLQFLTNLPHDRSTIRQALLRTWDAREAEPPIDPRLFQALLDERYANPIWTDKR